MVHFPGMVTLIMDQWPVNDRPREKASRRGVAILSNQELLAVILRTGTKECNVLELAGTLLKRSGGVGGLADLTKEQLKTIKGIGDVKATEIMATIELSKRLLGDNKKSRQIIDSPQAAYRYLGGRLQFEQQEKVIVLCLGSNLQLIKEHLVHIGTSDSSIFSIKEILKVVLSSCTTRFMVIHNHPSGDPQPSLEDINATENLKKQAAALDLELVDHLIFGENCFYSVFTDDLIATN